MAAGERRRLLVVLGVLGAGLIVLAAGLRPDAFFAGDPGVKLIAARNAVDHPTRPLNIDLPAVRGEHFPFVEPFFSVHDDHAHAITSSLFPLLTAPLLHVFGLRGLYVLPAIGFLLTVAGCAWLTEGLGRDRAYATTAIAAALLTPFLFYGLEFWEHAPALACGVWGAALMVRGKSLWSGLLFGAAVLLRPEALWFLCAALLASPLLPRHASRTVSRATLLGGAALALAPLEVFSLVHFDALVPPHVRVNTVDLGRDWLLSRGTLLWSWFAARSDASFWRVAPVTACAVVSLAIRTARPGRAFLWVVALVNIGLVVTTAPNDGGGQWGPRYLLFSYVPLVVLAADAVDAAMSRKHVGIAVALVALLAWSLWLQRTSYRQLRGTKATYGRIVEFVGAKAAPGVHIVTNVWWLDQIAAASTEGRELFYVPDDAAGRAVVRRLSDSEIPAVTIFRVDSDTPPGAEWARGTCYVEEARDRISTRDLVALRLSRRCPPFPGARGNPDSPGRN